MTRIFRDVFDDDSITVRDETTSADIEGWDSITHIDLIFAMEQEFRIVFSTGEAGSTLKNAGELRTLIEKKIASKG